MKSIKLLFRIMGLFIILTSCSDDNNPQQNKMSVFAKGVYTTATSKTATPSDVILTSFKVNATELSFKYILPNANYPNPDDNFAAITASGDWQLDLLNQRVPVTVIVVSNGTYKKAVVNLTKSLQITSPIYARTIEIRGYINGTPFVFWND